MSERPPRVLYVDDDAALARLVQRGLERAGYAVEVARDGATALERLTQGEIDAVALDHYLPTGTGLDLLKTMATRPPMPAVIYVTASDDASIAVAALKAGAADYVAKSVNDDFVSLLASAIDQSIEKRRLLEEREAALARAEVLQREVNHRVANSLSLVSSMVGLQAKLVADGPAKEALAETQGRILAISEIHKRLYSGGDIRFVEVDEYLRGLVRGLDKTLAAGSSGVQATVEADHLLVATDKAVSVGVVVTELVTNAFKYAYPPGVAGQVVVSLHAVPEGKARLSVRDDGVGWTGHGQIKGTGLGTRIIKAMATNLEAEIVYNQNAKGTEAMLTFALV